MTNFKTAFQQGLDAHADAERAYQEILSVFSEFTKQIQEATGDKITIERTRDIIGSIGVMNSALADAIQGTMPPREPNNILVARLKIAPTTKQMLCTYRISPLGYPVSIEFEQNAEDAYDRSSLEAAFERLLRHPNIGRKFQSLMNAHDLREDLKNPVNS